jgi:hypothetical protein
VHGFLPAVITDRGAQSQQRIDISAFPMHAWPFEAFLDDAGVGTLGASTPNGPCLLLKARIVHQVFALLQVMHLFLEILYLGMVFEEPTDFL